MLWGGFCWGGFIDLLSALCMVFPNGNVISDNTVASALPLVMALSLGLPLLVLGFLLATVSAGLKSCVSAGRVPSWRCCQTSHCWESACPQDLWAAVERFRLLCSAAL